MKEGQFMKIAMLFFIALMAYVTAAAMWNRWETGRNEAVAADTRRCNELYEALEKDPVAFSAVSEDQRREDAATINRCLERLRR